MPNEEVATVFAIHTTNQIINDVETQIFVDNSANRPTENKFRKELGLSKTNVQNISERTDYFVHAKGHGIKIIEKVEKKYHKV